MRWFVAAFLCLAAGQVTTVPREPEAGLYRDHDAAATYLAIAPGNRNAFRASINARLRKDPRNVAAPVHRP